MVHRVHQVVMRFSRPSLTHQIEAALALYLAYYHDGRIHRKLRVRPAMKAGIRDHVGRLAEIVSP